MPKQPLGRGERVGLGAQYRIERKLGDGGFGETYKAMNLNTGASVALKFLDDDSFAAAKREGSSAIGPAHDALVKVLDVVNWERPFVVMEFVDGESLSEYLEWSAPLKSSVWWQTLRPLLSGLHHLHARGLVHRDIKPANIILREGRPQQPVVVDFGAARKQDQELSQIVLAPWYADPEILQGGFPKPERSWDIYSLAVVSFEALFGKDGVDRDLPVAEAHESMRRHLASDTPFCQAIGKGLEKVDQRPKEVVDWLSMMVQPDRELYEMDRLWPDDVSRSSSDEQSSRTSPVGERHTVAAKCRELERTYDLPKHSVQLVDSEDKPLDGRTSLISFWKSWEFSDVDRESLRALIVDDDTVSVVRERIAFFSKYPEKSVRLIAPDREPYNREPYRGNTKVKTVRKQFSDH